MTTLLAPTVVLLDVDGTLVTTRGELPPSAVAAVHAARARGHRVYLCTGRSRAEIYPHLWDLGIDGLIGGNGSYVESRGTVVHHQVLPPAVADRSVAWLLERRLSFYLECNSGLYADDEFPRACARTLDGVTEDEVRAMMPHLIYGTTSGRDDVNKISFVLEPAADLDALAATFAGEAKVDTWSLSGLRPEFGEIGQLDVHKGVAVARLAEHLGTPTEAWIAFGDARSDLELFAAVGTGVAMGNAPDEVRAAADLVTDHVEADGLAHAFRRLGLVPPDEA